MQRCLSRYVNGNNFLDKFNPSHQFEYTKDLKRVYMGEAPKLGEVSIAFGGNIPILWLLAQICDLSEYSGVRDKLDGDKAKKLAEVIMFTWPYLNVAELMLFFIRFKSGQYGHLYASVDPLIITEALHKFAAERLSEISKIEEGLMPERMRAEEQKRKQFEERLLKALAPWNMTPYEYFMIDIDYGVTVEDIEEFGWLFRL